MTTPNINNIKDEALNTLEKEYDLDKSLNRYSSVTPELIEFVNNIGLTDEKDASRALFVSDYIFTSSEVSYDISDDERRTDVANMFLAGLDRTSSDILLKIFYLASKTHSMIRRSDVFMAGRGVVREASLITLKDIFIDPYLEICADLLGEKPCGWELSILASVMKKTLPGKEYEYYKSAPKRMDIGKLFPFIWKLLTEYNSSVKTEVNEQVVIPNIEKTNTILGLVHNQKDLYFSAWNFQNLPTSLEENKKSLMNLHEFISQSDDTKPFVYLRGKILNTNNHVFLIRDPEHSKPFFLLKSPVDEVNVTEITALMKNRGSDIGIDPAVIPIEKSFTEVEKTIEKEIEEEKEVEFEKIIEDGVDGVVKKSPTEMISGIQEKPRKKSFFGKLISIFKKEDSATSKSLKSDKKSEKRKKTVKGTKTVKGIKKVQERVKVKKELIPSSNIQDFISYALGVVSVGDLNLFQIFDTIRESNYVFSGVLYSDFKKNKSTFYASKTIDNPKSLTRILDGLDVVVENTLNHLMGTKIQIMPKEILFRGRTNKSNFVILFEGNKDHLVGIMGSTFVPDDSVYSGPQEEEIETFQRRTLKMRTNQLLKTLQSVHRFEEVFARVLGEELLNQCQEYKFEHAILNIYT